MGTIPGLAGAIGGGGSSQGSGIFSSPPVGGPGGVLVEEAIEEVEDRGLPLGIQQGEFEILPLQECRVRRTAHHLPPPIDVRIVVCNDHLMRTGRSVSVHGANH